MRTVSVFLDPQMIRAAPGQARVLSAAAPIREMILHSVRWPIGRSADDPLADAFFTALSGLLGEGLDAAIAVGFGSAFTRAFHQHTGDTPTAYRRRVTATAP